MPHIPNMLHTWKDKNKMPNISTIRVALKFTPYIITCFSLIKDNSEIVYGITAVISHIGDSMKHGHYVSYCKKDKTTWFKFNDSEVRPSQQTLPLAL